jgi:hypothetical protein
MCIKGYPFQSVAIRGGAVVILRYACRCVFAKLLGRPKPPIQRRLVGDVAFGSVRRSSPNFFLNVLNSLFVS